MKLTNDPIMKFDRFLPIYNWYYPLFQVEVTGAFGSKPAPSLHGVDRDAVSSRALYFHIPFCETICHFCPFVRGEFDGMEIVDAYTRAIIREVELKAAHKSVSDVPVCAIFFGGGTPSVLSPAQIRSIGKAIESHFDLSQLAEFSFELEVKSISEPKLVALKEIGVTHVRFGLQTFNAKYRRLFNLTATLDQIYYAIDVLPRHFPYASFDLLYGMDGQSADEFLEDVRLALATGFNNIDCYPINNLVTQTRLHRAYDAAGLMPTSGHTKFWMNVVLNEHMRAASFLPHNGHGYVRVAPGEVGGRPVVTDYYSFKYHEHVYGYEDSDLIGFGNNAISSLIGYTICNTASREKYISRLLGDDTWDFSIGRHDERARASKGVILHLPYHGRIEKKRVRWEAVFPETLRSLDQLIGAGLVAEAGDMLVLTQLGWYWYVNLMYFLSPGKEKRAIDDLIERKKRDRGRRVESSTVPIELTSGDG